MKVKGRSDEPLEQQVAKEALKLSEGDAALWYHYNAVLQGEFRIFQSGEAHWRFYMLTKRLAQFASVEQSVINGWRKYLAAVLGIPPAKQKDKLAINYTLLLTSLKKARSKTEATKNLKRRPGALYAAAKRGDADFLRAVGRASSGEKSTASEQHEYVHCLLSRWITSYFWLMPSKLVSGRIAEGLGVPDNVRTFLSVKSRYGLKSAKPTLVNKIKSNGELELTKGGRLFLTLTLS